MSHSLSRCPRRKYGAIESVEQHALAAVKPPCEGGTVVWQHQCGLRRAAVAFGVVVVGLAYSRPPTTSHQSSNEGAASLIHAAPQATPPRAPARNARPSPNLATASSEVPPLSFEAFNFYNVRDGKPGSEYPWLKDVKLIEPYRETTLSVSSARDGYEYIWNVHDGDQNKPDLRATASGAETVVVLTTLDDNMVTLMEVNSDGEVVRQLDELVMVKYVRREIRTLTNDEREELLDAMYTLWDVPVNGGNGKERYGDDYADIYAIARLHFKAAMSKTCDHFHDGLGFLTSHTMLSNTFEYSLQRVNPKLTLPYWDFTIEELKAKNSGEKGKHDINSPLFQKSWFGTADPDDGTVRNSRWANTTIPATYDDDPGSLIPDPYGRLRSSWNVNSSPYLTRGLGKLCDGNVVDYYPWPTCEMHHSLVTDNPDFYSWVWDGMYSNHGPVHTWIGGVLNCEDTVAAVSALVGKEAADLLALYQFDQRKNMWLDGYFECKSNAASVGESLDEVFLSGECGCLGYDLSQGDDWQTIYYNSTVDFDRAIGDHDDDTKRSVVATVCASTTFNGDHLQAGSSLDPTFWLMHPTMERLFMFSVLTKQTTDLTWPDTSGTNTNGTTIYEMVSQYGDTCRGHGGSDIFPFGLLDTDTSGFEIKTGIRGNMSNGNKFTNREVLAALNASVNMLPYVYDTFKWDHCLDAAVDFDDAWDTASADDSKKTSLRKPSTGTTKENHPPFREGGLSRRSSYHFGTKQPSEGGGGRNFQT